MNTPPQKLIPLLASVSIKLTSEQLSLCRQVINLHYLGDINCNEYGEGGIMVSKYPEKTVEHCKVYGAHTEIPRVLSKSMNVWLMDNGTFAIDPSEKIDPVEVHTVKTKEVYGNIPKGTMLYHCRHMYGGYAMSGYWADENKKVIPTEVPISICEIV